jgi:hypothetical protein
VLSCIAKKLPIVAISRDFLAFEDEYETAAGKTRCSVTLLPLSAGGAWVDYVYALVSVDTAGAKAKKAKASEAEAEPDVIEVAEETETLEGEEPVAEEPVEEIVDAADPEVAAEEGEEPVEDVDEPHEEPEAAPSAAKPAPGFSKLLDSLAGLTGFYGSQPVKVEPIVEAAEPQIEEEPLVQEPVDEAPAAEEPVTAEEVTEEEAGVAEQGPVEEAVAQPVEQDVPVASEGSLQNKLTEVRAKADEARMARLRANAALYEGLGAAYDFALDAEEAPEEYLRLVEAQGLKIQLRSPMKPVVKLAFADMCDDATIKQLEAVLAWAFDEELPRGTLAERIEAAGGIGPILNGQARAA